MESTEYKFYKIGRSIVQHWVSGLTGRKLNASKNHLQHWGSGLTGEQVHKIQLMYTKILRQEEYLMTLYGENTACPHMQQW